MIRSTLRAGLGALVVAVSVALMSTSAQASPTPSPTPAPTVEARATSGSTHLDFTTSGTTGEKMLRAAQVMKNSGNRKDRHMDWGDAKKYFGDHTTWRDDFAAGYIGGGGYLDNAAQSTKDRLKQRWADLSSARLPAGGTNCQGSSKDVPYSSSSGRSEAWYNSCDTNTLIYRWGKCTAAMGFATARVKGWAAAIPGMFGLICGQKAAAISLAKDNSSVKAVKYYFTRVTRVGGNGLVDGQVRITVTIYSQ